MDSPDVDTDASLTASINISGKNFALYGSIVGLAISYQFGEPWHLKLNQNDYILICCTERHGVTTGLQDTRYERILQARGAAVVEKTVQRGIKTAVECNRE